MKPILCFLPLLLFLSGLAQQQMSIPTSCAFDTDFLKEFHRSCPDFDNDGTPYPDDKCPREKGDPNYEGCAKAINERMAPGRSTSSSVRDNLIQNGKSGLRMKAIPGGTFTMGSPNNEDGRDNDECKHPVTVNAFKIGFNEVTQADWWEVMGSDSPELRFKGCDDCPVENVSWNDIQEFLNKLNAILPPNGGQKPYRLPTEAEWEFAARGGNESKKYVYAGGNNLDEVAWNANKSTNVIQIGFVPYQAKVANYCF